MGTVLKGGTLVELEPASVEVADLRIDDGHIVSRGPAAAEAGDEVIELGGKLVMPGLVCAHHHLYSSLARGMPPPAEAPENFLQVLERVWWRLDRALDLDAVQVSSMVGALEALSCGTTTVFDHHASPSAIAGSLTQVARGVNEVGLRAVLCYEVSDRHGAVGREEGLAETTDFLKKARGRFRGMIGAHACFTLSREALEGLKAAVESTGAGLHIHLAEDGVDQRLSFERYGEVPVARLMGLGLLGPSSVIAHAVHLSWPELSQVISTGAWLVHNPRSNMNNQVGYAPAGKFGSRATLGTDGIGSDMFAEAQLAYFRSRDAGQPIGVLHYLRNAQRMATEVFGAPIGPLREGALADLLVLDYRPSTPLTAENLAGHFLYGLSSRHVEAVMIDGIWRMWARRPLSVDGEALSQHAREAAASLWARMAEQK
ncbi:MAG: amidohydrolase family protein [Myxococcales bacterium]|nr:amidohydrolase family protein [Myxococcales bacterium]